MLFLVFHLGKDRYAIDAAQVVEVLHSVETKTIPNTQPGVAGIFDYHGSPVPLIDLAELILGRPSHRWMSTRIILVNYLKEGGPMRLLGVLAEQVTETLRRQEEDFTESGVADVATGCLGRVTIDPAGIVQRVEIRNLLSQSVRDLLFQEGSATV